MTTTFWNSWALWEKLCFVLACAIVLTILAGCVKLFHKHYELRRHTAIAERTKEDGQAQQAITQVRERTTDIPFGVRAIESGVEVDGVWISRSNTPASSNAPSPASSIYGESSPAKAHQQQHEISATTRTKSVLNMSTPMYPDQGHTGDGSRSASRSPEIQAGEGPSTEKFVRLPNSSEDTIKIRVQPTYRPRQSSHLRFSSGDTLGTWDADNNEQALNDNKHRAQRSQSSIESASHYVPNRLDHLSTFLSTYKPALHQNSVDDLPFNGHISEGLGSVAAYQQSRAAGLGQLAPPRSRNSHGSADWSSVYSVPSERGLSLYHESKQVIAVLKDPFTIPNRSLGLGIATDPEDPPSFQSFVDSDPLNAQKQSVPLLANSEQGKLETRALPLKNTDANRQMKPPSDVSRKVNSGFEVLRPGTFSSRRQSSDNTEIKQMYDRDKRVSGRLHKKNRSESASGRSSHFSATA